MICDHKHHRDICVCVCGGESLLFENCCFGLVRGACGVKCPNFIDVNYLWPLYPVSGSSIGNKNYELKILKLDSTSFLADRLFQPVLSYVTSQALSIAMMFHWYGSHEVLSMLHNSSDKIIPWTENNQNQA